MKRVLIILLVIVISAIIWLMVRDSAEYYDYKFKNYKLV